MTTHDDYENHELRRRIVMSLLNALLDRVSSSVRGVTLAFDGKTIRLTVLFVGEPTAIDVDNLRDAEAEFISHHDYMSNLIVVATERNESINRYKGNWGWVFLRYE